MIFIMKRIGFLLECYLIIVVLITREFFQYEEFIMLSPNMQNFILSDENFNLVVHR
jgi:hypothetical protein